ncbi:MAG: cytochrome c oxidase subunit II [Sphingomonadales bacterium]|nr:MAG: cytochrome c oxidase subunit II [Sphingomonadales bacterium]
MMRLIHRLTLAGGSLLAAMGPAFAEDAGALVGQPTPGAIGLQPAANALAHQAAAFHNDILMPIITVITLLVLGLLLWIVVRYRRAANPTPSKISHNTLLEVVWTGVPVLILVVIAIPSFRLLYAQYEDKPVDVTIKVTGHQWYWSYEYPDSNDLSFDSVMLTDDEAAKAGAPRLLGVDNNMVVPAGKRVKLIITAADVIHSWAMPSLKAKMDAVPGRLSQLQFQAPDKPGLYYGQCSELCGVRHGFMPIAMEVLPADKYADWLSQAKAKFAATPSANQYADAGALRVTQ